VPNRRDVLRGVLPLCAAVAATVPLGGCANRPPAPPPPPPKPVALLGVLPVLLELPQPSSPGFGANRSQPVYMGTQQAPRSAAPVSAAAGLAVGLLALGITMAVANENQRRAEELAAAVSTLDFDPAEALDRLLGDALERRGIRLARIDADLARELRGNRMDRLPAGVDALLDVRVTEAGYYRSMRAGALSPQLNINASLMEARTDGDELDSFTYYADFRSAPKDPRWFTTPKELTFDDTAALRGAASRVREGLQALVERIAEHLCADVHRHVTGQPRLA